jgi:streptogramin lyase
MWMVLRWRLMAMLQETSASGRWGGWFMQVLAVGCVLIGTQATASALDVPALQDNFTGSWKSCLWDGYQRYGGATYEEGDASYNASLNTVRNDRLDLKVPSKYLAGMSWETGLTSTYELRGNFDIQVDFFLPMTEYWTNLDMRGVNVMFVELMAGDAGARRRQVRNSQFNPNTRQAVYNPHLWVANHNDNKVTQIDTDRAVILGQYDVGSSPSRTTVDLNGDVWINHRCDSTVWRIRASQCTPPTCTVAQVNASYKDRFTPPYSNGQCNGGGAAVDKNNNPWIGFLNAKTVVRLDRSTGQVMNSTTTPGRVYGLAVDNNDFVWSDEHWDGVISKIDSLTGNRIASYSPNDGLCFAPYGISVDSFGKIWTSNWGTCPYLTRFDPNTNTWSRFFKPGAGGNPDSQVLDNNRGVAGDNQGLVWTVSSTRNKLSVWNMSSGQFIASYATCGTPTGVALDRNNLIWVTCADGNVYRHDRNGQILNQIPMGYSSYSYSDMTGYQLRNFGSDAWKESFLDKRRESSDTYYLSSIENNYGGGIENGVGSNVAGDPTQAPVDNLTTISSYSYKINQMFFSDYYHTDRLTRIIAHPPELEGLWGLRTPYEDRTRAETNLVSMRAKEDLDVFVAFDSRAAHLPGWLDATSGYVEVAGKKVTTTDAASPEFKLYKKTFARNATITLGGAQTTATAATSYASCAEIKRTFPTAPDGTYTIRTAGADRSVFCDMRSDMGAGHTMLKVNLAANKSNSTNQDDYRAACAAIGMEVIVPRSYSHGEAIKRYNGGNAPNLVNVFPKYNGAQGLENWTGRCQGQACGFYISPDRNANCGGGLEPNGDNNVNNSLYRWSGNGDLGCGFARWNDGNNYVGVDAATQGWVICSTNDAQLSTQQSCADIVTAGSQQNVGPDGTSGAYTLSDRSGTPYQAWCNMATDGGGWTLGMKLDRNSTRFNYDSADWTVNSTYNSASTNLAASDAKFAAFANVPLDEVMVGMNTSLSSGATGALGDFRLLRLPIAGASLMSLFQGGTLNSSVGRNAWKGLLDNSSLQANCNAEGININPAGSTRVRVGIVNNQENDCNSPDSRLGLGGRGNACGQNDDITAGNSARCTGDNGNVDIAANGLLFARKRPADLVGHWPMNSSYADVSGRSHNFSPSNMLAYAAGVTAYGTLDKSASFNGTNSFLETASSAALNPDSMTISMWLNLTGNVDSGNKNNWRALLYKGSTSGTATGYDLVLEENRTIAFDTGHAGGSHRWWPNRFIVQPGKWVHMTFTYDAATRTKQAFLDGQLIDSVQVPANLGARAHNTSPLRMSNSSSSNPDGAGAIPGNVDDVRLYSGVLSEQFIQTLAGKTAGANVGNYFVYFVPTSFTTPPPSPGAYTLINDPAHNKLQSGGQLRVVRNGSNWTFWYRDLGSGTDYSATRPWVNMGTLNLGTQDAAIRLRTRMDPFWHNGPTNEPGGAVSVQFDNYKVNSADGVVGGPSEICDGIDNDCDAAIDETFPGKGDACNTGLPGVCAQGFLTCTNGGVVCQQINKPGPELCDGLDNDCNGSIDDYVSGGQTSGGATVVSGQSCTDNTAFGPCRSGQYVCDGGSMVCRSAVGPKPDICDGIDNDCDGTVDNDSDNVFYSLAGHHLLGYQRSSPYIWPRPIVGTTPFFTDNNNPNDDYARFDGASSLAPVHALRKARVILYLDPSLANAGNPRGRYVLWLTHGKKDAAQGAASVTYGIRYKDGQPFDVLFNDQNETQLISGGGDKYQSLVVSSASGETGGVAVGPFDSQKIWDMELSISFSGDIDGWELYNAELDRGYSINQEEKLILRNNFMEELKKGAIIVTADTGTPCRVSGARGICALGTGACVMGRVQCTQTVNPQPEVCDGLDNSCDGAIDDADPNLVIPIIEAKQKDNNALADWTRLFTIDNGISAQEQINFIARGGDDRVGSPDMRDVADPMKSIQGANKSLVTFHRDMRPEHGTISMPLIQGKRVEGLDGAVSAATRVEIELETIPDELMTSFYDDRIVQEGAAADEAPRDYSTTRMSFRWTLSRWREGLNFIREADAAIVADLFVDKFAGLAPNLFTLKMRDKGSMTSWTLYQPYRDPIALIMDKDAEFRARAVKATDASCVIQDHPLAECLGAESRYFCVGGELRCHNNPSGCCLDLDGDGHYGYDAVRCDIGTDCDDKDATVNPGAAEICDGKDNNCGGCTSVVNGVCQAACSFTDAGCILIDESFPEAGMQCEDAARMITNLGVCRAESQCINGELSCEQIIAPSDEICDGLDNNCDGETDGTKVPMSEKILGPEECKYEPVCSCKGGLTGVDNCNCIEGLSPTASAPIICPAGSSFNGVECQDNQCAQDADCAAGNVCISGVCQLNAKQNPVQLGASHGANGGQAGGCAQAGGQPMQLAPVALTLLGLLGVGRRRRRA